VQIFASNAQVSVRNVLNELKTFENIRKLYRNIRKLSGNIRKYSNFFYPPAHLIEISLVTKTRRKLATNWDGLARIFLDRMTGFFQSAKRLEEITPLGDMVRNSRNHPDDMDFFGHRAHRGHRDIRHEKAQKFLTLIYTD